MGKPKHGPIFENRQKSRLLYRKRIRDGKLLEKSSFSDNLHSSLASKNNVDFWKLWKDKFDKSALKVVVENSCDPDIVVSHFAEYFRDIGNPPRDKDDDKIDHEFTSSIDHYSTGNMESITAETVGNVINKLHKGKSPGSDQLTPDHFLNCHDNQFYFV